MTDEDRNELHDYSRMNPDIPLFMREILFRAVSEIETLHRFRLAVTDAADTLRRRAQQQRLVNDLGGSTAYESAAQVVEAWFKHAEHGGPGTHGGEGATG